MFVSGLLGLVISYASASRAETLADAIEAAYVTSPALESGRASSKAANERITQAKAQFGPSISADAGYGFAWRRVTQSNTVVLKQESFSPQLTASLDQPLFTFGRLSAQRRIAEAGYATSIADLRAAEQDILANVIIAYTSVLRDQKLVEIANQNLAQLTEQLDQTVARYNARYATETELQQTRNRIFTGKAQLEVAEGNLLTSRNNYRKLIGHYPQALSPLPQLPSVPATIEDAQKLALKGSPLLDAVRFDLKAAQARVAQAKGAAYPQVALQANISRTPLSIAANDVREINARAQVVLSMPIFTGGYLSARTREAGLLADSANQQVEQTSREVRESVANHWDLLSAARRAMPSYIQAVSAAQKALDGAQEQQRSGQITSLDVLDTARDLLVSRQAQAQSEAQLYVQHALLLGSMGQLRAESFSPHVPPYDASNFNVNRLAGLPTGPLIEAIDSIGYSDHFKASHVIVEDDSEAGHEMAPEPLGIGNSAMSLAPQDNREGTAR